MIKQNHFLKQDKENFQMQKMENKTNNHMIFVLENSQNSFSFAPQRLVFRCGCDSYGLRNS